MAGGSRESRNKTNKHKTQKAQRTKGDQSETKTPSSYIDSTEPDPFLPLLPCFPQDVQTHQKTQTKENFPNNQSQAGGQYLALFPLDRRERVLQLDDERGIMFGYRGVLLCPILRDVPGKPGEGKVM